MVSKVSVFLVLLLAASACTSNKNVRRKISSQDDRSQEEKDKDYWEKRGAGWTKFEYDGYQGGKLDGKFRKAVLGKGNLPYTFELSNRRQQLFEENLFDTGVTANAEIDCGKIMKRVHRTPYGECYFHNNEDHLSDQDKHLANQLRIGAFNERFGRNMKADDVNEASKQDLMTPSPLEISEKLLSRNGKQVDAPVINVLATAWLQAMNHDWFTHGKNSKKKHYDLAGHKSHEYFKDGMKIPATRPETESEKDTHNHDYDKTFRNQVTHWWDASQIYGSSPETIRKVRSVWRNGQNTGNLIPNGKIAVDVANRRLRYDAQGLPITGFHDNWWTGLELIHTLFHLEHNHIVNSVLLPLVEKKELCYEDRKKLPQAECDEILFEKARMINSALMAKIHTVEWTPALLDNQMLHVGMRSNWYGMKESLFGLKAPFIRKHVDGSLKHLISGLTGKHTLDLYSVPFTLTEEFVAVYRMHPLVPDFVTIRDAESNKAGTKVSTKDMIFRNTKGIMAQYGSATWLNSFGTSFPGAMTLHNYPTWMKRFKAERNTGSDSEKDAIEMDMGAVDIFRDRERGILKYNEFRRKLHMPAIESFAQLTPNKEDQKKLEEIYGDIENVDLLVGTLAEADRYPGYAFGNTPFYIFALMASRRLMADPFFSDYYTKDYYTKQGIDHVQDTDMAGVIIRHFPEFKNRFYTWQKKKIGSGYKAVKTVKNAFRPWLPVYSDVKKAIQGMDSL